MLDSDGVQLPHQVRLRLSIMNSHHSSVCGLLLSFLIVCPGAAWSQQQWRNLQSDWLFEVMPQAINLGAARPPPRFSASRTSSHWESEQGKYISTVTLALLVASDADVEQMPLTCRR